MPDPDSTPVADSEQVPDTGALALGLGNLLRWQILRELAAGEPLMVLELAERLNQSADVISKHLAVLRGAGLVAQARNRLYQIPPRFLVDRDKRSEEHTSELQSRFGISY